MQNIDLTNVLKGALKSRNNPTDLKAINIAKVVKLEPLTVSLYEGKVLLREDNELYISEWFRFRCNINKTEWLSKTVPDGLQFESLSDVTVLEGESFEVQCLSAGSVGNVPANTVTLIPATIQRIVSVTNPEAMADGFLLL